MQKTTRINPAVAALAVPVLCALALLLGAGRASARVVIEFDYSLDSTGFFSANPQARTVLDRAGKAVADRFLDTLSGITPSSGNTWQLRFTHPGTGQGNYTVTDATIATNVVRVYVGARTLANGQLAVAGPGGYTNVSGFDPNFINAVQTRGQAGVTAPTPSDVGPWGGTMAFNSARAWNFDLAAPAANKDDFLTVAVHELTHVLGLGTTPSWRSNLTERTTPHGQRQYVGPFTGPNAVARHGGPVPLESVPVQQNANDPVVNAQHFQPGLSSTTGQVAQEPIMAPQIQTGTRKRVTLLDWAAMDDIGWDLARVGDATADGWVDFLDLAQLAANYNVVDGQRLWSQGDFNGDGRVDFLDLALLASTYNTGPTPGQIVDTGMTFRQELDAAFATVPEPANTSLLAAAALLLRRCRRKAGKKNRPGAKRTGS